VTYEEKAGQFFGRSEIKDQGMYYFVGTGFFKVRVVPLMGISGH
jgi:hypothetical protein